MSILSSAYGVGFERRCIGDKPDVQYHYFYKSRSQEAIAYIYHRLDSFLYWTTEHVFSVFFVQANHARICPWKHRFNLYFFGVPFDQRHVVWRYYDPPDFTLSDFWMNFDQRLVVWRYYDTSYYLQVSCFYVLWPTTCCLALLRLEWTDRSTDSKCFACFDQRHVVWRYYDIVMVRVFTKILAAGLWPTTCCLALLRRFDP